MRSTVRRISIVLLLAVLLAPGLSQARTPVRYSARNTQTTQTVHELSFLGSVWNLLTSGLLKTGPTLDPSGGSTGTGGTTSSSTTGDTGPTLDPSGVK